MFVADDRQGLTDADRATVATALESQFAELLGVANSTDGNGQYRVVDLRPGAYTVTAIQPAP